MAVIGEDNFDDDELADRELPDQADMDADEFSEAVPCPYCAKPIHEQTDVCQHCGSFVSLDDMPRQVPTWILVGLVLTLLVMIVGWIL